MSGYTSFVSMTEPEARAYLDRFLAEMGPSLVQFATSISSELTHSKDSLEQVWDEVRPKLAWRQGYLPPRLGQPGPQILAGQLESPQDLPSWFHHPSGAGYARFSAETLWLIDGTGRYLGETLIRNVGGAWNSGAARTEGYMFQNQPVIAGITPEPASPIQACAVLVARALRASSEQGPQSLIDVYENWSAQKL